MNFLFIWLILGVVAGLFIILALLVRPGWILPVFLLYIWLIAGRADRGDLLESYPIVRWGSYLLIPIFGVLVAFRVFNRRTWRKGLIESFVALLAGIMFLSATINHTGLTAFAESIGVYLRYPLFFLFLVNLNLLVIGYKRALRWFLAIFFLVGLEAILNFVLLGKKSDGTFFTLGVTYGTITGGGILLYGSCFVIAHALVRGIQWYHLVFIVMALVASIIATVRSNLFGIPVSLFLLLLFNLISRYRHGSHMLQGFSIAFLVLIVIAVLLPWQDLVLGISALKYINPSYRFESIQQVFRILASYNSLLFGFGPRSFSPGTIGQPGQMIKLLIELRGDYYARVVNMNQFVNGLSELGLAGFVVYWTMMLLIMRMNLSFLSTTRRVVAGITTDEQVWWSVVSLAFIGIWFYYAGWGLLVYDLWRMDMSSLVFWVCAAAIYSENHRRSILQTNKPISDRR